MLGDHPEILAAQHRGGDRPSIWAPLPPEQLRACALPGYTSTERAAAPLCPGPLFSHLDLGGRSC